MPLRYAIARRADIVSNEFYYTPASTTEPWIDVRDADYVEFEFSGTNENMDVSYAAKKPSSGNGDKTYTGDNLKGVFGGGGSGGDKRYPLPTFIRPRNGASTTCFIHVRRLG